MTPRYARPLARHGRLAALALAAVCGTTLLTACAPLIVGGAALGGAMMATDRRTSGAQLDDQTLEIKAGNRVREVAGERAQVSVNAYARKLLLTGEVHKEADKAAIEEAVAKLENVKVINELTVDWPSSSADRSRDIVLQGKVKTEFLREKNLEANAFSIVAHRGVVYLMGKVTENEAAVAVEIARAVPGVTKVVKVLDIITPEQLAAIKGR